MKNLPFELINKILIIRPTHPIAHLIINPKIKEYNEFVKLYQLNCFIYFNRFCFDLEFILTLINHLQLLSIKKEEAHNENYIRLLDDEIDFYKKKVYDYSNLYENYT
jgi:hypothetical protein